MSDSLLLYWSSMHKNPPEIPVLGFPYFESLSWKSSKHTSTNFEVPANRNKEHKTAGPVESASSSVSDVSIKTAISELDIATSMNAPQS